MVGKSNGGEVRQPPNKTVIVLCLLLGLAFIVIACFVQAHLGDVTPKGPKAESPFPPPVLSAEPDSDAVEYRKVDVETP
jgi:hypothetical protein